MANHKRKMIMSMKVDDSFNRTRFNNAQSRTKKLEEKRGVTATIMDTFALSRYQDGTKDSMDVLIQRLKSLQEHDGMIMSYNTRLSELLDVRACRLEHDIARAYGKTVDYINLDEEENDIEGTEESDEVEEGETDE